MTENIEKLARYGKKIVNIQLENSLGAIDNNLYNLKGTRTTDKVSKTWYDRFLSELKINLKEYIDESDKAKKEYGLEFPNLQKRYEKMLPQINKYLEVNKN